MMPASTTLASSQPRWGDQKAPITAAPKTSQNPFRHLVGRGAPCVSASSKAPAGHAAGGGPGRPSLVIAITRLSSCGATGFRARPKDGGDEQGFGAKQQQGRTRARNEAVSDISRRLCPRVPPSSGKRKWRRRTDVWREATSPARGFRRLTSDGSAAHSSGAANWRSSRCGVSALPVFTASGSP